MAFSVSMQDNAVAEMNITPLVDVLLVLLVIFMVSVPIVARPVQASLPQTSRPTTTPPPVLQLGVAADGAYRLDGRLLAVADLQRRLDEAVLQGDGHAALVVRANSDAEYQSVVTALAVARTSGVADIAVIP